MHTRQSVFLTGKAGTGKTTFLRQIKHTAYKQLAVLAPTGVAAIQATGSTIHSFFQLPFGPFVPAEAHESFAGAEHGSQALLSRIKLTRDKRNLMRALDLLIIDEVSMVRADVMDAIDQVLRHVRMNQSPFGGVQMLLIGDLYQLPPVVKDQEWNLLRDYYEGPYFFYSHAVQKIAPVYIELEKVYRQQEADYLELLNGVRTNSLSEESYDLLHSRYLPMEYPEGYITLTTHNATADAINERELKKLSGRVHKFKAVISGDFPPSAYPGEEELQLKIGAQVMFTKNDSSRLSRFFNGKVGEVTGFDEDGILVRCEGEANAIMVATAVWENFSYAINPVNKQVEEKLLGSFEQFPLRLAWAVTIHKSQGLTFDKVIVDAGKSFSPGQAYVALSRCTTLQGMILHSRIPKSVIFSDRRIQQYGSRRIPTDQLNKHLESARSEFQQFQIKNLFAAEEANRLLKRLARILNDHKNSFSDHAADWISFLLNEMQLLSDTTSKFNSQLDRMMSENGKMPEEDEAIQERIGKAAAWYNAALTQKILPSVRKQLPQTDNQEFADQFYAIYDNLVEELGLWQKMLSATEPGFSIKKLLEIRSKKNIETILAENKQRINTRQREEDSTVSDHPELFSELKHVRNRVAQELNVPHFMIASTKALLAASNQLPRNERALLDVKGFGKKKVNQYGEEFLEAINVYCFANDLKGDTGKQDVAEHKSTKQKTPKKENGQTQVLTLELWKAGKSIEQIAAERSLAVSTIEGHFSFLAQRGLIPVNDLISEEKLDELRQYFLKFPEATLNECREAFQHTVSFAQARLVKALMNPSGKLTD